jgi:hypothetical protein
MLKRTLLNSKLRRKVRFTSEANRLRTSSKGREATYVGVKLELAVVLSIAACGLVLGHQLVEGDLREL